MASTDDLSLLMPNLRRGAQASSADTGAVREYLRGGSIAPAAPLPQPPALGRERLNGRLRSGRQPQRQSFGIKLRPVVVAAAACGPAAVPPQPAGAPAAAAVDEEQLKDELLARFLQHGRAQLAAKLRTERQPANRQFGLRLHAVVLPAPPAPEPEKQEQPSPGAGEDQENVAAAEPQTAPRPSSRRSCDTPGTSLLGRTPMEGVPERLSVRRRAPATAGKSATPFTPMEGVPEGRTPFVRPVAGRKAAAPTPFTPVEGIPEGRTPVVGLPKLPHLRVPGSAGGSQQGMAGGTVVPSVDSPIMGVVQQRAAPGQAAAQLAAAAAPGSPNSLEEYADHGCNAEPSPDRVPRGAVDAAVQTGRSLRSRQGPGASPPELAGAAAQTGPSLQEQLNGAGAAAAAGDDDDDGMDYGGDYYDDGGFDYDDDDHGEGAAAHEDPELTADQAGPSTTGARRPRQQARNPGIRIRNELGKRKSLGANPQVGRREVAPGVRRSMRQRQVPLEWWRGEQKMYGRKVHKTLPTVEDVVHKPPNTPWRTVSDYRKRPKQLGKQQQRQQQEGEEEEEEEGSEMES